MLWMSANLAAPNMAIGASAITSFHMGFVDGALCIVAFACLGALPVCLFSALGAKFGLRQMVLSRFYFGYHLAKLTAALNIITMIGWTVLNALIAAQIIHAIDPRLSASVSIIIAGLATLVIALFGHKVLHTYERWALVPCAIVFFILLGFFAHSKKFDSLLPLSTGQGEFNAIMSLGTALYGATSGWCMVAADYLVYQPAARPTLEIYLYTFFGLTVPIIFTQLLGLAIMTATVNNPDFSAAYSTGGVGAVLAHVLPGGGGKFCLVVLALTIIANNAPPIYSISFSIQLLSRRLKRIPRPILPLFTSAAYVAIAIPAYEHFAEWLGNFLVVFGYWTAIYQAIAFVEHCIFLKGAKGYEPDDYEDAAKLPKGYAALAGVAGGILGTSVGMVTAMWTGPVAKALGGADVGMLLSFLFGGGAYMGVRLLEKRAALPAP
ncbi:permease for cytosine/purines, uracil, thiamine, allantoin-domain-containing protein [Cercophora newfieldiana]|uniref:Permease for cytosine/purines, uracil, thiamine, allantoin-domain-containing protein n=1 Tax=Cercophora newfieldiana TaxID=92897 RepID=A0AA39YS06_9PEZI|nr:permease for cytosine/purines, uracil, thiamine, allantoin-domain-containing protein [Cercophora newfieldiana]